MCRVKDQSGRIALHSAAIKGKTDVAQQLIEACPETASERTPRGETVLHLAVINNQFEALEPLVGFLRDQNLDMKHLFNSKDGFGQTILHLAVQVQNFQMVKLIVSDTGGNMDLSATNSENLTALEMVVLRRTVDSKDIEDVLRAAAAGTGGSNDHLHQDHRIQIITGNNSLPRSSSQLYPKKGEASFFNGVMVVAALVATLSFQAALNPPGGVWQDWGNSTNNSTTKLQSTRVSSDDEMNSLSAQIWHQAKLCLEVVFLTRLSGMKDVGDENRHMPGKSIAREL